jgi:hypothetical protein
MRLGSARVAKHGAARSKPNLKPHAASAPMHPKDFLAHVVMHIPDPCRHVIRYNGTYLTSRRNGWVARRGLQDRGPKLWGPGWRLCDAVARSNLVTPQRGQGPAPTRGGNDCHHRCCGAGGSADRL